MKNSSLNKLFDLVAKQPRRRLVVANGTDQHSLEAISKAVHEGLVTVMVTGNENEIIRNCRLKGILVDSCEIVHCENDDEDAGVGLCRERARFERIRGSREGTLSLFQLWGCHVHYLRRTL